MSSQKPQSGNIPSSFDKNEGSNSAFVELTMEEPKDDLDNEEESQAPKKRKKRRKFQMLLLKERGRESPSSGFIIQIPRISLLLPVSIAKNLLVVKLRMAPLP
ncbi:hypothetical protein V6N13_088490 [Hibiscus sabdariffa]|uniref:Uncharacterized protein n=1 Tax=Hibiscus sabdariffa TaxID=183260 RepID=A0ABR2G054_9ROSI